MPLPPRVTGHTAPPPPPEAEKAASEKAGTVSFEDFPGHHDDYDDCLDHEALRPSKPKDSHQTFIRMDEISKQVQRMSVASLTHVHDFRKSLREKGIVDPHEQEEMMIKQAQARRESFSGGKAEGGEGENWEAAEENFLDDVSRSTMEEHFVRCVQPDVAADMRLLELLGQDGESKLFLDYQRIVEYFRHKNALMDRKIGLKSMNMAVSCDDGTLKELSSWHGEAQGRKGPRKALKKAVGSTEKEEEEGDPDSFGEELEVKGEKFASNKPDPDRFASNASSSNAQARDVQVVSPAAPPPPGIAGRRNTLMGVKRVLQGVGKFKNLSVNTGKPPFQDDLEPSRQGSFMDEASSHRSPPSGASTPTSQHPGEDSSHSHSSPKLKPYMMKGMGRLFKRPPKSTNLEVPTSPGDAASKRSSEVSNPGSHNGDDEEPRSPKLKMKNIVSASIKATRAARSRASLEAMEREQLGEPVSPPAPQRRQSTQHIASSILPQINRPGQPARNVRNDLGLDSPDSPVKPGNRANMVNRGRP